MLACVMFKKRILLFIVLIILCEIFETKGEFYSRFSRYGPQLDQPPSINFRQPNINQRAEFYRNMNSIHPNVLPRRVNVSPILNPRDPTSFLKDMGLKFSQHDSVKRSNVQQELRSNILFCTGPDGKPIGNLNNIGQKAKINITVNNSEEIKSSPGSSGGSTSKPNGVSSPPFDTTSALNITPAPATSSGSSDSHPGSNSGHGFGHGSGHGSGSGSGSASGSGSGSSGGFGEAVQTSNGAPEKTKELQKIIQELYVAQAQVQLEATEIQRSQAIAASAQSGLEEAANNVRIITAALHAAQQTVASAAIRAQTAQLQLAAHDQLLFSARQKVDALSAQMVGLQAEEGIGSPKVIVDVPALLHRLKQPLPNNEKPTPIPSILGGKPRGVDYRPTKKELDIGKVLNFADNFDLEKELNMDEVIANGKKLIKFSDDLIYDYVEGEGLNPYEDAQKLEMKPIKAFTDKDLRDLVKLIVTAGTKQSAGDERFINAIKNLNDPAILQPVDPSRSIKNSQDKQYINDFLKSIRNFEMERFGREEKSDSNTDQPSTTKATTVKTEVKQKKDPNINDYILNFKESLLRPYLRYPYGKDTKNQYKDIGMPVDVNNEGDMNEQNFDDYDNNNLWNNP